MKTEILHSYIPRDGYCIDSVLPLTESKTAIFTSKYKEPSYLEILNIDKLEFTFDLSKLPDIDTSNYYKCYFNLGSKFGLIHRAEQVLLFDIDNSYNYEILQISNPFNADEHGRKTNVISSSTNLIDNKILFGLSDYASYGYPARYIAFLEIVTSKSFLGIGKNEKVAKWHKLFELPKKYFPETSFHKYDIEKDIRDWLNIRSLVHIGNHILIQTTGGTSTRLKSGTDFEFNIFAKFDKEFNWIENIEVEKGFGKFSTDKKHFIQHPFIHKNKLFFYNIENMTIDFEISLTAKQNLGQEKVKGIIADKLEDTIYLFNHRFLNICALTK